MSNILFSVKFNGQSKLLSVSGCSSYTEFIAQVHRKWNELEKVPFNCMCSVGPIIDCCLDSEDDFKNIISLCEHTSSKLVLVDVVLEFCGVESIEPVDYSQNAEPVDCRTIMGGGCGSGSVDPDDILGAGNTFGGGNRSSGDSSGAYSSKNLKVNHNSPKDMDFVIPSYAICPELKKKPLLSDEWEHIIGVGVGQIFDGGADVFRKELIKFATHQGFNFRYVRNTKQYVHASCSEEAVDGCSWFVKGKMISENNHFVIYKANLNHSCVGKLVGEDGVRLGSKIMADLCVQNVKNNHAMGGRELADFLLDSYGIDVPYWKARRAIEYARNMIFGRYDQSYNELRWYKEAIERTNPGSLVFLEVNPQTNRFERMFIAFKASVDGFRFCRPMLFIDATFMKGRAKGTLLIATAKDGNNGLFPVAFAIVGAENAANWEWFLRILRDEIHHPREIVFISDRNTGLLSALPLVWDKPLHFFCLFHLLTNLKGKFSRGCTRKKRANLANLFTQCAYAPSRSVFHEKLELFKKEGGAASEQWIEQLPFDKWAVAYSPHIARYGEMTSNAAESFNSWIRKARYLPITNMIDAIRKKLSLWYVKRSQESSLWSGSLCPDHESTWQRYTDFCKSWKIDECQNSQYVVHSNVSASVNTSLKVCTCGQWQIRGFPCPHAVAVFRKIRSPAYMNVDEGFLTKSYRASYSGCINPIPDTERYEFLPNHDRILPPLLSTPPGRPKTKRKRSYGEGKKRKKKLCKTCGVTGYHDSLTCLIERAQSAGSDSTQSSEDELDPTDSENDTPVASM